MKNTVFKSSWIFFAGAAAALLSACSLQDHSTRTIQITIPNKSTPPNSSLFEKTPSLASILASVSPPEIRATTGATTVQTSNPVPVSLSDFSCYAVNVVGPGIQADPRLACGDPTQYLGVIAGFVPAGVGTVTLTVPNGSSRQVQLVGVKTTVGCPDLNTLLNNKSSNSFNGISQPYLLASTTVDIFADTSVDMTAVFDPLNPKIMFQGCGGDGPSFAPTLGFTGKYTLTATGTGVPVPVPGIVGDPAPAASPAVNGSDLTSAAAMTIATLASIPVSDNGTTPPVLSGYEYFLAGYNARAVMQFQWDTTSFDLTKFSYARVRMLARGGQRDGCVTSNSVGVAASIWDQVHAEWIPLNQQSYYNPGQLQWFWVGNGTPIPVANLLQTKADGKKYVVVNVESNYAGNSNDTCASGVRVGEAALQLLPAANGGNNGNSGSLWLGSTALPGNGSGSSSGGTYVVQQGSNAYFYAAGGTPPYTYSVLTGGAGGTIDQQGKYTAPATGTSDTIQVTDGANLVATASVNLQPAGTMLGFTIEPLTPGPYTAGSSCLGFTISTVGFGYSAPSATTNTFSIMGFPSGTTFFPNGTCTPTAGSSVPFTGSSATFSVNTVTQAGNLVINAQPTTGTFAMTGGQLVLPVHPGAVSQATLFGPPNVTGGYCQTYTVSPTDAYLNIVGAPGVTQSSTISSLPSGFFSDSTCATPITGTFSIPAGASSATVYFKSASTGAVIFTGTTATGTPTNTPFNSNKGINVAFASTPVGLQLTIDPASPTPTFNTCILMDVTEVDSYGTAQFGVGGVTVNFNSGAQTMNVYGTQANCTANSTAVSSATIGTGQSTAQFWVKTNTAPQGAIQATATGLNDSNAFNLQY